MDKTNNDTYAMTATSSVWPNFGESSPSGKVWSRLITTPSSELMLAAGQFVGASASVTKAAIKSLKSGRAVGVVFSGKIASGKDTVALEVSDELFKSGYGEATIHRTSDPIRAELDDIIDLLHNEHDRLTAVDLLVERANLSESVSTHIVDELFELTRAKRPNAEDRTNTNRHLQQYLADEGRRSQDPDYWVKKFFPSMLESLAEGRSAYLSGGRYPNEIGPAQTLGMVTVRLVVSRQVQIDRLTERDIHFDPKPELMDNANECALDGYVGFNLVVGNDGESKPTVECITKEVMRHADLLKK